MRLLNAKILSQVLGQSLRWIFFIDEIFDNLKINPGSFTQVKFIYNCEPLFIIVIFIYRIPRACVIKFAVKSSIFVSAETKYVSQIHLDVPQIYRGSCHRRAFQAFAIPLLFDGK